MLSRETRLSTIFWGLARGSGAQTSSADPLGVVRHLLAAVRGLSGTGCSPEVSADALTFLLQLENDPYYASPEQIRGGEKDSQCLVYSVAVVLFERLTGHHPFVESLSPMRCALSRDRSRRVGKNNLCSLPQQLRALMARAMSPFPEDRFANLPAFANALDRFVTEASGARQTPHASTGLRGRVKSTPPPCPGSTERAAYEWVTQLAEGSAPKPTPTRLTVPWVPQASAPTTTTNGAMAGHVAAPGEAVDAASAWAAIPAAAWAAIPAAAWAAITGITVRRGPRIAMTGAAVFVLTALAAATVLSGGTKTNTATASTSDDSEIANAASGKDSDRDERTAAVTQSGPPIMRRPISASPLPRPDTTAARFDATRAGQAALSAIRPCFRPEQLRRGAQVGVSLRYSSATGLSDRVYFAADSPRGAGLRRCLKTALVGLSAGAPPKRGTIVTYTFWLSTSTERQRVRRR